MPVTRYLFPSSRRASGGTLSLGMSILMELEGSETFAFITSCQIIWPLRERNQLMKTLAALGFAALLMRARPLFPLVLISAAASLRKLRSN